MKTALLVAVLVLIVAVSAQLQVKPGACSPDLPIGIYTATCREDSQCPGIDKCCRTRVGGTVCSAPVSVRQKVNRVKPGNCPNPPTGRWVCSHTCSVDVECRGRDKCCRNRCGALVCTKPVS